MIFVWVATAVAALILAVVALVLALLAVPVGVRAAGAAESERVTVKLLWLFGAVRIPLTGRSQDPHRMTRRAAKRAKAERAKAKRQTKRNSSGKRPRRPTPGEVPAIVRAVTTLLRRVLRRFRIVADADVRVGLDDPADTGLLWGVTAAVLPRLVGRTGLRVQPSFAGASLMFSGHAAVDVVPITVAAPLLRFFLSRDGRTVVRILRRRS